MPSKIIIYKYENIIKKAYKKSEKFIKKKSFNRIKKLELFINVQRCKKYIN